MTEPGVDDTAAGSSSGSLAREPEADSRNEGARDEGARDEGASEAPEAAPKAASSAPSKASASSQAAAKRKLSLRERLVLSFKRMLWVAAAAAILAVATLSRLKDQVHDELGPLSGRIAEWAHLAEAFDPGPGRSDVARILELNGQALEITTEQLDVDVPTALAEMRETCPSGDTRLVEGTGYFLCFEELGGLEWSRRFSEFGETRDVADLGEVRYAYVAPRDGGAFRVAMRPLGSFKLDDLVPHADRDVAGRDARGVPRPPAGRRVLAAEERGEPYAITMYGELERDPESLFRWYRDRIDRERFVELDVMSEAERLGEELDGRILYLLDRQRPASFVVLHFEAPRGSAPFKSYVTIMEAR